MTEILFYHLQRQPIERVLPTLLEKSIERGWRVVVQVASEERLEALAIWRSDERQIRPAGGANAGVADRLAAGGAELRQRDVGHEPQRPPHRAGRACKA